MVRWKGQKEQHSEQQKDYTGWCVRIESSLSWLIVGGVRKGAGEAMAGERAPEGPCVLGQKTKCCNLLKGFKSPVTLYEKCVSET